MAKLAELAFSAYVALATVPVTLAPVNEVNPAPLPINTLPAILPVALINPVDSKLPPVILPATLILLPDMFPEILPIKLPAVVMLPVADIWHAVDKLPVVVLPTTLTDVNAPTLVMLACAACVTY